MRIRTLIEIAGVSCAVLFAVSAVAADLYRWVDDRGVTNYSNEPPPPGKKAAKVVAEDRISVYTPDPAVTQAIEAERNRRNAPRPAAPLAPPPGSAPPAATAPPPPPPVAPTTSIVPSDACLSSVDPNCYASSIYDVSPVFYGRVRPPVVLNQPQLPAGAIAGNVTGGNGITPGLSGTTPVTPPPARSGNMRALPGARPGFSRESAQ